MATRYHPELYHLQRVPWTYFGTLTWRSVREHSERRERAAWFVFVRAACKGWCVWFPGSVWVLRSEVGERLGRPHLHFLFSRPGTACGNLGGAHWLESLWPFGFAQCRPYDRLRNGASYISECLGNCSVVAAAAYESLKFGRADSLLLSRGLISFATDRADIQGRILGRWQKGNGLRVGQ